MNISVLVCLSVFALAASQFSFPRRDVAHREALRVAALEAQLHPNLLNRFYKDPNLRPLLAKSSLLGPGENLVRDRESDKIPKRSIFNVLNHAGLLPQQQL